MTQLELICLVPCQISGFSEKTEYINKDHLKVDRAWYEGCKYLHTHTSGRYCDRKEMISEYITNKLR